MPTFILSSEYDMYTTTPGGCAARIISTKGPKDAPIVAVIRAGTEEKGNDMLNEMLMCFNLEGEACTGHRLVLK